MRVRTAVPADPVAASMAKWADYGPIDPYI